jgi:transposase
MLHRHELSQRQWERLAPFFPDLTHRDGRGRPWQDHQRILKGILWRLHTGTPWRDLPERYGPWETIYSRFRRWRQDGTWARILTHLLNDLERQGGLGHQLWLIDATIIRASRAAAGAKKKSRLGSPPPRTNTGATGGAG